MVQLKKIVYWILFTLSTAFFIHVYNVSYSWDFFAYILNAQHWFGTQTYFEIIRPPLTQTLIGLFSFMGWNASAYIYIIFCSGLFAFATIKIAKQLKVDELILYVSLLSTQVLMMGLFAGSELLSLTLIMLGLAYALEGKPIAGLFLGLAALTRYNNTPFILLILFLKDYKKILQAGILFVAIFSPWLVYNYLTFGNMFRSMAELYAMNIIFRQDIIQPVNINHIIRIVNIYFFALIGIFFAIRKKYFKELIIMILIGVFVYYNYATTPVKYERYLFLLALPLGYFAAISIQRVIDYLHPTKKLMTITTIVLALSLFLVNMSAAVNLQDNNHAQYESYQLAITKLQELRLDKCAVLSDAWVHMNYYGINTENPPANRLINKYVERGYVFVYFAHIEKLQEKYPKEKFRNSQLVIFGDGCTENTRKTYLENKKISELEERGKVLDINPCNLMFKGTLNSLCNWIN